MTDEELISRLRIARNKRDEFEAVMLSDLAANRIEELISENKRLGIQCDGLMQVAINNDQEVILLESRLKNALDALFDIEQEALSYDHYGYAKKARDALI